MPRVRVDTGEVDDSDVGDGAGECEESGHSRPLGGDMAGIDDRQADVEGAYRAMVRDVTGDEGIGDLGRRLYQVGSGTGDHGHPLQHRLAISRHPQAGDAEDVGGPGVEGGQCLAELTHPTDRRRPRLLVGSESDHVAKVEDGGERIGGAARGCVEVGVCHQHGCPGPYQPEGAGGRGSSGDDPVDPGEEKRVIRDQQVDGFLLDGGDHGLCHLMAHPDPGDLGPGITYLQPDRVPCGRGLGAGPLGKMLGYFSDGRHPGRVTIRRLDTLRPMRLSEADAWQPPEHWRRVTVVDSHAAGEPFRVVTSGLPPIPGETVLERRRYAREHLDDLRKALMWEPRGHADMYGGWIGDPVESGSDLSVLFVHNEGFSTMCGHGIIALTKVLLDIGAMPRHEPETTLRIDTPAGQVTSVAHVESGLVGKVSFRNVASYVDTLDGVVTVPGIGEVRYDLAFGGAYYAYVDGPGIGMRWPPTDASEAIELGRLVKKAFVDLRSIDHPGQPDLGFLYGVIFTGPAQEPGNRFRNVCVFADGEIDRSPTGTGVSGLVALECARGNMEVGDTIAIESIIGTTFTGTLEEQTIVHGRPAVVPVISGRARITGRSEFWFDPDDELSPGFLLR